MKKLLLISTLLVVTYLTNGQVLKIQAGISISSLDWKIMNGGVKVYDQKIIGQSIFIGLDYFRKKYFNLSSNIGTIKKGGSSEVQYTDALGNPLNTEKQKATLDYLSFNTTVDLKYPINGKIFPFLSVGPRVDYLLSNSYYFSTLKNNDELNKLSYGLNLGAGIKYQFLRFQIGIRGDYLLNLNKISEYNNSNGTPAGEVKDKTFLVNAILGFKLK